MNSLRMNSPRIPFLAIQLKDLCQKSLETFDDDLVVPVLAPAIDVDLDPVETCKTISIIERDYWRYRGAADDDGRLAADVVADVLNYSEYISAQEALSETAVGSFFTASALSTSCAALERLSKTPWTPRCSFAEHVWILADYIVTSRAAT